MSEPSILAYAAEALSTYNVAAMLIGVFIGLVIGAIPGLNPPIVIALLLPASYGLPADSAIILMVSVYAAGIYGGSFSAILLKAPGTPASAASAIEGYAMTQRGEAVRAIRVSTFASVTGGIASAAALMSLAPPLSHLSLLFGPAEMFMIALLGLTTISAFGFANVYRGLLSGLIGLSLSTIGVDVYSGFPRYTFGWVGLEDGIGILPAIVGLFAFAQGLELCQGAVDRGISRVPRLGWRIWPHWAEIVRVRWSLARGGLVGLTLGLVPAAGASVAQWLAYAWEIRRAAPGDKFGNGETKGLAATEACNNACTGTSLIPLFVLGIPGGISAVVILGALMIHGLQPGMRLFRASPEIVYTIMWGFLFANIVMGMCATVFARLMANLTLVPRGVLGPVILVFCVVGIYTGANGIRDVGFMIAFGLAGYLAHRWDFSPAALLLGLILGPIAESGFRDMMVVSGDNPITYILSRPLAITILAAIVAVLFHAMRTSRRSK